MGYAWDMLTCSVIWQKSMKVQMLVQSPISHNIAAFSTRYELYVFKPSRQDPIYHHSNASNSSSVTSAIFIPHNNDDTNQAALDWQTKETLYYMTKDMKLLTLGVHTEEEDSPYNRSGLIAQILPQTPFSILMSEGRKSDVKDIDTTVTQQKLGQPGAKFLHNMLGAPAHTLPPVSSLCQTFMDSLMIKKDSDVKSDDDDSDDEPMETEDISSDSDGEEKQEKETPKVASSSESTSKSERKEYKKLKPKLFKWMHQ